MSAKTDHRSLAKTYLGKLVILGSHAVYLPLRWRYGYWFTGIRYAQIVIAVW
jgi:hypothetical protein